ncbi:unnamed protein product, partial [Ectocarpus sp. 12 AP-2014]
MPSTGYQEVEDGGSEGRGEFLETPQRNSRHRSLCAEDQGRHVVCVFQRKRVSGSQGTRPQAAPGAAQAQTPQPLRREMERRWHVGNHQGAV